MRTYGLVSAVALIALVTLLVSPSTQAARTGSGPTGAVPEQTTPPVGELPGSPERASREAREAAYDRLALDGKLTIKQPAPEEPPPTPEPAPAPAPEQEPAPQLEQEPVPEPKRKPARAGATSAPVLPEITPEAPTPEEAPVPEVPRKVPRKVPPPARAVLPKPTDNTLRLTVPRLGISDVAVGDSPEQSYLDREGIMHLSGTGFPFKRNSNTYIAGHAADYDGSRVPNVFRNLHALRQGDLIALRDANGKIYRYRVYERLVVSPRDVWVTEPVAGKKIVSLQTCFPAPSYEKRLIVRGELVK